MKLRSQDCPYTAVDFCGVHYLVVRPEGRAVVRLSGAGRRHDELCLITTIGGDGAATHVLVPTVEADAPASRCHDVLHPGPGGLRRSQPSAGERKPAEG